MKTFWNLFLWFTKKIKSHIIQIVAITILSSICSVISVSIAMVSKNLIDNSISGSYEIIFKWLFTLVLLILFSLVLSNLNSIISTKASETLKSSMQSSMYNHIVSSKWIDSSKYSSIDYLTRMTNDISTICSLALSTIPSLISYVVMLIVAFIALMKLAPLLAYASITMLPFLLIVMKFFARKYKRIYKDYQEQEVIYRGYIQESLKNLVITKSFTLEDFHNNNINKMQKNKEKIAVKQCLWHILSSSLLEIASWLGYILAFLWGIFNLSKGASFGTLMAIIQLFGNIQKPLLKLSSSFSKIITSVAACERIMEIESLILENDYTNEKINYYDIPLEIGVDSSTDDFSINFNNVYYKYPNCNNYVLKDINLNISSGEIITLIGPSGEGKTTFIRLLLSLLEPTEGELYMNCSNIKTPFNKDLRKLISYVPQESSLISGTIKDNILYGKLNATNEELIQCTKLANAFDFIQSMPNGFDTSINENSSSISGGQAQRICLSRAFLKRSPIIILDEATSALDKSSELFILNSLKELDYNPIIIIITHKTAALDFCTKSFKLVNGSLVNYLKK